MRSPERRARLVVAAVVAAAVAAAAEPKPDAKPDAKRDAKPSGNGFFDEKLGNKKEPITVTSDTLEYDYKANVVVYRGGVQAVQGAVTLKSDTLTVTLERAEKKDGTPPPSDNVPSEGSSKLREIVAVGNVRIDSGTRWATGGRATFDQSQRTLVLTETPVLHDGQNEVAGDRVVVYLDEDRSVVEGGRKRVKAVLYPGKDGGLAPAENASQRSDAGQPSKASP